MKGGQGGGRVIIIVLSLTLVMILAITICQGGEGNGGNGGDWRDLSRKGRTKQGPPRRGMEGKGGGRRGKTKVKLKTSNLLSL